MTPTRFKGSNIVAPKQLDAPIVAGNWTTEQLSLVKRTLAKDATNDELALFMATANRMQLDPFAKQIYFVKDKSGKVTIMVSIDGVRLIAHRTGRWNGTRRGVKRDENGKITHGWAEVWVKGVDNSVYEETPFNEYYRESKFTGQKNIWDEKPETMIKKVPEMAALRIAFPQELGSVYIPEEMGHDENEIREKTVSDNIADRFKEETCNQSSISSKQLEHQKDSPKESSENCVTTPEPTLPLSNPVESYQVQDDGFGDILPQQALDSKTLKNP